MRSVRLFHLRHSEAAQRPVKMRVLATSLAAMAGFCVLLIVGDVALRGYEVSRYRQFVDGMPLGTEVDLLVMRVRDLKVRTEDATAWQWIPHSETRGPTYPTSATLDTVFGKFYKGSYAEYADWIVKPRPTDWSGQISILPEGVRPSAVGLTFTFLKGKLVKKELDELPG